MDTPLLTEIEVRKREQNAFVSGVEFANQYRVRDLPVYPHEEAKRMYPLPKTYRVATAYHQEYRMHDRVLQVNQGGTWVTSCMTIDEIADIASLKDHPYADE